jgi:hypothetical protein
MKKFYLILFGVWAVIMVGLMVFYSLPKPSPSVPNEPVYSGILVLNPMPGQVVSSPLTVIGSVNGNGWTGFEGQVGTVKLVDSNGKELATGILTADGDWMVLPTNFKTTLSFGTPDTEGGSLIFKNENASGDPEREKTYTLPIKFK